MTHLTGHPEACPCGPRIELVAGGMVVVHRLTLSDRLGRAWARLRGHL